MHLSLWILGSVFAYMLGMFTSRKVYEIIKSTQYLPIYLYCSYPLVFRSASFAFVDIGAIGLSNLSRFREVNVNTTRLRDQPQIFLLSRQDKTI